MESQKYFPKKCVPLGLQKCLGFSLGHFALSCLLELINIQPDENSSASLSFHHGIVPTPKSSDTDCQKVSEYYICSQEWEAALASLGLQDELKIGDPKPRWGTATILRPKESPGALKGTVPPLACLRGYQQISWEIRKGKKTVIPFLIAYFQSCWISLKRAGSSQILDHWEMLKGWIIALLPVSWEGEDVLISEVRGPKISSYNAFHKGLLSNELLSQSLFLFSHQSLIILFYTFCHSADFLNQSYNNTQTHSTTPENFLLPL